MTIPGQAASLWHEMSKQIAVHIAEQATNQIPIVGPVAMIILRTALRRLMCNCSDQQIGQAAQWSTELGVEALSARVGTDLGG